MKKIIFLALVLSAPHAVGLTGNQWLEQTQSTDSLKSSLAYAYLAGILDTLGLSGLANVCPAIPDGATTTQIRDVLIKYFEDNPEKRHIEMPTTTWSVLVDKYGGFGTDDDGICPF